MALLPEASPNPAETRRSDESDYGPVPNDPPNTSHGDVVTAPGKDDDSSLQTGGELHFHVTESEGTLPKQFLDPVVFHGDVPESGACVSDGNARETRRQRLTTRQRSRAQGPFQTPVVLEVQQQPEEVRQTTTLCAGKNVM